MGNREAARLFPGEVLDHVTDFPCLYRYFSADKTKPLVVLIPGGAHNARIFYGGHAGHDPEDFLASWLTRMGFGALGISYPIESEPTLMPAMAPGFRINGWSMGGRLIVPYTRAAQSLGLNVKLFVSLSATPGLPGLRPPPQGTRCTEAGYATFSAMPKLFVAQIHEQEQLNNKVVIPSQIYFSQYYGHTPVSLLGWGFKFDCQNGFIDDNWDSIKDAAAHDFACLPWISTLWPTSQLDARHGLSDKATWAFMLTQKLTTTFELLSRSSTIKSLRWDKIVQFVHSAPESLSTSIRGNHYFFLGRSGAKATAEGIIQHLNTADTLRDQLKGLIEDY